MALFEGNDWGFVDDWLFCGEVVPLVVEVVEQSGAGDFVGLCSLQQVLILVSEQFLQLDVLCKLEQYLIEDFLRQFRGLPTECPELL